MSESADERRPVAAVVAICLRGDEVLLVRRAKPPDQGLWGFPGGRIELGETLEDAALRELAEETGVVGEAAVPFSALDVLQPDGAGGWSGHFVLIAVACRYRSGEPAAASDATEARWFDLAAIERLGEEASRDVARIASEAAALAG